METSEIIKKVRKIEIKTRGLSQNIFAGEYHSAFKGTGMSIVVTITSSQSINWGISISIVWLK